MESMPNLTESATEDAATTAVSAAAKYATILQMHKSQSIPRPVITQPQKSQTDDHDRHKLKVKKRIIICCDGTWQDGLILKDRWKFTNVLRLARAINHSDERHNPHIPQVVFYQSGVGTDVGPESRIVDGATGATLADKVQEAYAFIAHNYEPGDEIFAFGFSRGAYTARMIVDVIGHIGILDRMDMDHFATIFIAFQKRGKAKDPKEISTLDDELKSWTGPDARGRKRANCDVDGFVVKCVGVFDTVGALGLPDEITFFNKMRTLFGFNDTVLGAHIERAYHAMALNEKRSDFKVCKYEQSDAGRQKGQLLKQTWFAGCHSDIGGGYEEHDLSDLTLTWMAANIEDALSLDIHYLATRPDPVAPYGRQPPHDSVEGAYVLAKKKQRDLPSATDNVTHEMIHPSVLQQESIQPEELKTLVEQNPKLVAPLAPLEEELKLNWPFDPAKKLKLNYVHNGTELSGGMVAAQKAEEKQKQGTVQSALQRGKTIGRRVLRMAVATERMHKEGGQPLYDKNNFGRMAEESHMGPILKEIDSE